MASKKQQGTPVVIVESPAKARTIGKYLGSDYRIEASIGHIRDLPSTASEVPAKLKGEKWAKLGIDVEEEFRYEQAARNLDFAAKAKRLHGQLLANEKRFADAERLLQASLQLKQADDVQQLLHYVKNAKARAASKAKQQAGK